MHYLDGFITYLDSLPSTLVYVLLGVSAFVENVFPPIPGDTITAFGAFLVGMGRLHLLGVYGATTAGSLAGFMTLFLIGGRLGRRFFVEKDYRFFKARDIVRAEEWFRRYGYLLIVLNRFLPGIRSALAVAGGFSRLRGGKAATLAFVSCSVWNLLWISLGYALGDNWETVRNTLGTIIARYNTAVGVIIGIGAVVLVARVVRGRRRGKGSGR